MLRASGVTDANLVERLVRLGGGSPGQALALADPALWEFRRILLRGLLDPRADRAVAGWEVVGICPRGGQGVSGATAAGGVALRLVIDFLNDAVRLSVGGDPQLAEAQDRQPLVEIGNRLGPERLLELLERCLEADVQIDRRVNSVLVLDALLDAFPDTRLTCRLSLSTFPPPLVRGGLVLFGRRRRAWLPGEAWASWRWRCSWRGPGRRSATR